MISNCATVSAWTQKRGVTRLDPSCDLPAALGPAPFEYLFSIVNHAITPAAVLALPTRAAVNYHDSPLPAYGGFNATAWAILQGESQHGVTWHRMTDKVDAGATLLQRTIPVLDDDTAFSLATRCGDLAVRSFSELVQGLESEELGESPGQPVHNFHFKSDRPALPVLSWQNTARALGRLVRGLDFGTEDNWMSRARLVTPESEFLCVGTLTPGGPLPGLPGTVARVDAQGVAVVVQDGSVVLADLTSIDGVALSLQELQQLGVTLGAVLPQPEPAFAAKADALDRAVTKTERYWLKKLAKLAPSLPSECKPHAASGVLNKLRVRLPVELSAAAPSQRQAAITTALAAYLARVGDEVTRVDVGLVVDELSRDLRRLYATVVPLSVAVSVQTPWADLKQLIEHELQEASERKTYARDIYTRYASLRGKSLSDRTLPMAMALSPWREPTLPKGVVLLLCTCSESNELELVFDAGALTSLHAQRLAARLVHILGTTVHTPLADVASLSVVTPEEQDLLLRAFQDTDRPAVQIACIHELIAAQAARTPDATALIFRDQRLTYAQVEARANALAHHLCTLGVVPDALVAVCIERSLDMVIGMLAILKAGGAYVPLDPAYPQERLAIMLEDSGARWLLTQSHLASALPRHRAEVVLVSDVSDVSDVNNTSANTSPPVVGVKPEHLAYVIFTSGSTGRPKGVMVEHRNVANFFAGMDERVGTGPGHWLAVTSISFDISVLEIFWTLARGFETVVQEEGDRASLLKAQGSGTASSRPMGFGLFYFAADSRQTGAGDAYRLLLDGARFADTHGFTAVWTPERHFHEFGGLYPNPAVTSAAVAAITSNIAVRAGSVVIPLHDPIRVAEEWAMVDNLSGGRVGLSFASGWHANDFALKPENYEHRQDVMRASIDTVLRLWAGEKISVKNGLGETVQVSVLPRPVRARPPMWIASAGNIETFRAAGRLGYNVLTNMLGQDYKDLAKKFAAYREARQEAGHDDQGIISVMLHTFVTDDDEKARQLARVPFGNYLKSSYDLVKVAPWMFPAFKRPARQEGDAAAAAPSGLDENDMAALLDHAFDRYFDTAGLFGTPARALRLIEQLKDIGATEVACLIDFGIDPQTVLANLVHLDDLRRLANPQQETQAAPPPPISIREQFEKHRITHFQCTPSMARILIADGTIAVMGTLEKLLVGGEAMPADLAATLSGSLPNTTILNMYGPTETTVWSTCAPIGRNNEPITIGTPIANTQIRLLDSGLGLAPLGTPAELCIGGASVVRGYLNQPDLTAARFIADPFSPANRLYRTGDLARYRDDGAIEYIGRMDQQVKVNGYRIELGEIETILNRHVSVKEAVVAVKQLANSATLVAYVITTGDAGGSAGSDALGHMNVHVNDWQHRWDQAYCQRAGATSAPARFNTSGWLSSYTGEPLPESDMRQWLDETVNRILALQPKRVLEIGCGTGMLLYACLPKVSHYTALDLSPFALESIRAELTSEELAKVTLLNQAAHDLNAFDDHSFDLVIINSVAQYFPNAAYLMQVLEQAARVLIEGGRVFLGDVRSLEEATAFSALVELHKAPGQMPAAKLGARIEDRTASEAELLLATAFFAEVNSAVPGLSCAKIALKRGHEANEMRDFRYDVILQAGARPALHDAELQQAPAATSLEALRATLLCAGDLTVMKGLPNARLAATYHALAQVRNQSAVTVQDLRQALSENHGGFDPNQVLDVSANHDVELRFGTVPGTFDALFRRKGSPSAAWPVPPAGAAPTANTPKARTDSEALVPKLKAHIRDFLPEYMIPQNIVFLQAFPLTPNGKIDRKVLPQPTVAPSQAAAEFAVPSNDLERTIADIWRDMLGIERVGRKDNIFDLGASSLLTVEANGRLQTALGRKIPLVTMFRYPTVETLAAHLGKSTAAATPGLPTPADNASGDQERDSRLAAAAERRRQARTRSS